MTKVTPRTFVEAVDFTKSVHEFFAHRRWFVYNEWLLTNIAVPFDTYVLEKYGIARDEDNQQVMYYAADERKYLLFKLKFSDHTTIVGPIGQTGPVGPTGCPGGVAGPAGVRGPNGPLSP